jgi:histidine ammonia-lyase
MEWAAALSIEAHRGTSAVFDRDLNALKSHAHQQEVAARFRKLLQNSPHMNSHEDCELVQDSYSFRCIPQVLSPAYSLIETAEHLLRDEANSVTDNPVLFTKTKELKSGGHFHAQAVSMACDLMALSIATIGNLTERRVDQLMNPLTTRTSGFLTSNPGVESGLMIVQTAMAAIASENKGLAHPASIDTIPTNGNQEDHVSMAPWAGIKALRMVGNLRRLVAGELLCAVRASVLEQTRSGKKFSPAMEKLLKALASEIPELFVGGDRVFGRDWEKTERYLTICKVPKI